MIRRDVLSAGANRGEPLLSEYHALVDLERDGRLSPAQASRLREVQQALEAADREDPRTATMLARLEETAGKLDRLLEASRDLPKAGITGEINHRKPLHLFPNLRNAYDNLYRSCRKCNAVKSGLWPSENQIRRGLRFLDPCTEDHDDHRRTQPDGSLVPTTLTGRYTIRHVCLDRPTLTEFRRFLWHIQERAEAAEAGLRASGLPPEARARLLAELEAATAWLPPPILSI